MSTEKDGGPAFPLYHHGAAPNSLGMSLRDYFIAHAPAKEVADLIPDTVGEIAEWLGMASFNYDGSKHWVLALAKARRIWADAMIAERSK